MGWIMRKIKFRAWDEFNNKMIYPEGFIKKDVMVIRCNSGVVGYEWVSEGGGGVEDNENLTPMQFTGLLDKNGKEIYEGDIVEFPKFNAEFCEGEYLPRQRFEVSLDNIRYWLKEEQFGYEGELLLDNDKCEVIGNIYENSELLKESK